jgi:hypothetical protein
MTEKVTLAITDKKFQSGLASTYQFNLLIGTDGLSYMVADELGEVLVLKSWSFVNSEGKFREVEANIRSIYAQDLNLGLHYGKQRVAIFNNMVTLVPNRLFNADELSTYFNLLLQPDAPLSYRYDDLREMDAKLVFAIDKNIVAFVGQNYPNASFLHSGSTLLVSWHKVAKRTEHDVFVNLRSQVAQIAVFDRRNLLFYNTFTYTKAADFLYFTLLSFDQLKLDPNAISLNICGELVEESEIYKLLYRYFKDIRFVEIPKGLYQFPGSIEALPNHMNYDLFAI